MAQTFVSAHPVSGVLTEFDMIKWNAYARPLPLPEYHTPRGGCPLRNIPDDVLLTAPPHLIAHVQRTAAQGGLQIISPRQIPFSQLMLRTIGGTRMIGDHVVGSIAAPDDEWPTIDGADFSHLLPDEPLAPFVEEVTSRAKTRTTPLTSASHEMADPILACLVKGRAVIDILRRDDVQGGAEEFAEVLARAWGIEKSDIEDLEAFTLGVQGPLLRHAIKTDDVYPTYYAPIHIRKCISVGCSDVNRTYLPEDSAMDWRRMRVFCEAVFALTCMIEGHPIKYMRCYPPPGDTGAPSNRMGVMCFQPAPATAWTFSASTFSLMPNTPSATMKASAIPSEVLSALARHVQVVKPMSYALSKGREAVAKRTTIVSVEVAPEETITSGYNLMVRNIAMGMSRGRFASSAVRNLIYTTLEGADLHVRLRLARYIMIATEESKKHLGLSVVPDLLISRLADRFLEVGDTIRLKVVGEAVNRGSNAEEWWADITSQAPERYKDFVEGTKGWANVAMYLVFREPTNKWHKLAKAVHYGALRTAEVKSVGGISLPAIKGSPERLLAAARAVNQRITTAYCGYYKGVSDVGLALADVAASMGRERTSETLREAAYLWVMRARCFRGTNIELMPHGEMPRSPHHVVISSDPANLVIVPAPYKAFQAYKSHVARSTLLRPTFKRHIAETLVTKISDAFRSLTEHLIPCAETTLTRYLVRPNELHQDMEAAWKMLSEDMDEIGRTYGTDELYPPEPPDAKRSKVIKAIDFGTRFDVVKGPKMSYWDILAEMEEDEVNWIDDLFLRLPPGMEDLYMEKEFDSAEEMRLELQLMDKECMPKTGLSGESVN